MQSDEVYHWYASGPVPPVGLTVNVIGWPLSIIGELGVTGPAVGSGFTVSEEAPVVPDSPAPSETVTLTE